MEKKSKTLDKIRKFGGYMSGMVMPNLGAFVGWGLLAALFIPTGWMPNEKLNEMVSPILNYLLPLLIGYTAGYNIHGQRGGVIGAFTTMGVIVGSDVTMFSGAMIMGPLSSWLLKKFDDAVDGKIKPGFEMFVNNFSLGILGFALAILGYFVIGPVVNAIIVVLTAGINFLIHKKLIPLLAVFMCPAQVLFLNNAVNHGIISPIAYAQAQEAGKSLMFLLDSNCGPLLGTLCSIALFGKGKAKETAPMAMFIAGIAGIGEVYFPFVLANPIMIFATMGGLATSLFLLVVLGGGLVGMPSPGSLINIALMTPKDAAFANLVAIIAGFCVALVIGSFLLKTVGSPEEEADLSVAGIDMGNKPSSAVKTTSSTLGSAIKGAVNYIVVACDSGMGSSAMGASVLKNRLRKEGFEDIKVVNSAAGQIDPAADMVITLEGLIERAKMSVDPSGKEFLVVQNFLKESDYDEAVAIIRKKNGAEDVKPILTADNIRLNVKVKDKEDAIRQAGQILVDNGYTTAQYIEDMQEREKRFSVYIGNHLAIPHGIETSDKEIYTSGLSVLQVPEGVDFDGETAYMVIGIAGKDGTHLNMLSTIALICADEDNIEKMRQAKNKEEIMDILKNI